MPICSAHGCSARSDDKGKKTGITSHTFPLDDEKRKVWGNTVERKNWTPAKQSALFSAYFEEACFVISSKRVYSKDNAVPSIFKKPRKKKYEKERRKSQEKASKCSDLQQSSSIASDDDTELNTKHEDPDIFANLKMLSHACTLMPAAQPSKVDFLQEDSKKNETQKLEILLRYKIDRLKSKLAECENKNKRYKKKIKTLEQRRLRKLNVRDKKERKIIDNFKQRNLLNDDLLEISKNMTNEHIELFKKEIHENQASDSSS